jgi:site-specific recombinase XerC
LFSFSLVITAGWNHGNYLSWKYDLSSNYLWVVANNFRFFGSHFIIARRALVDDACETNEEDDVNLDEELLRVNKGKGGKDRVVPLSGIACQYLENYIKAVRPELAKGRPSEKLFISIRDGLPIGRHGVARLLAKYTRKLWLKKHVTCHLWRHSCATHLLKNNANLRHVQQILGHKSLATTERYLRLTITDLKEAHRKFHPREQQQRRKAAQQP